MIYFDSHAFPCDQTGDGGDSAVRAGILKMAKSTFSQGFNLLDYQVRDGVFVRHPFSEPWNNENNLTWDNKLMLFAGFKALGLKCVIREAFKQSAKRFFFGQNIERDKVGSRKFPYPHEFINDKGQTEKRLFDFRDPEFIPNRIGVYILGGEIMLLYPLLILAYPWHLAIMLGHVLGPHNKENQMIAECDFYGTLPIYRKLKPTWEQVSFKYWNERSEKEYHFILLEYVNKAKFIFALNSGKIVGK